MAGAWFLLAAILIAGCAALVTAFLNYPVILAWKSVSRDTRAAVDHKVASLYCMVIVATKTLAMAQLLNIALGTSLHPWVAFFLFAMNGLSLGLDYVVVSDSDKNLGPEYVRRLRDYWLNGSWGWRLYIGVAWLLIAIDGAMMLTVQ